MGAEGHGGRPVRARRVSAPHSGRGPALKAVAAAISSAARSYADDDPAQFALAVLVTLLCALLLVRALRRDLRLR